MKKIYTVLTVLGLWASVVVLIAAKVAGFGVWICAHEL
jgi:hypothetical protein